MEEKFNLPVLTLEQAAAYLQLTVEELQEELEKGRIPALKVAGKWRIKREVLERLLESTTFGSAQTDNEVHPTPPAISVSSSESEKSEKESLTEKEQQEDTVASPQEPSSLMLSSSPGRVRARVFSYNSRQGFGYARLPDNRVVWIDSQNLTSKTPVPSRGDIIEFELHHSRKLGLVARAIQIVSKGAATLPKQDQSGKEKITERQPSSPFLPAAGSSPQATTRVPVASIPPNGTPESQVIYQQAALASTEGRFDDARRLFYQAIEAGAGIQVYAAFFKLLKERGSREEARRVIERAIQQFPSHAPFYEMYGQWERRLRNYQLAERIFRRGLECFPSDVQLKKGLAQTLVQIGTEESLREAGEIFKWLEQRGKLNKDDRLYHRFKALQRTPRANKAYGFFHEAGMRVGIAGRRDLPPHITDLVVETDNQELKESFGLSGALVVRCFQRPPSAIEIRKFSEFLRGGPRELGLQDGREVVINPSIAFIAVPNSDNVRDQIMSILSDNNEAIVPLDDAIFQSNESPLKILNDLLGHYLGLRDLYSSTMPVSGRRFFGRERLLLQLRDEIYRGQFLGIYGLRKMGKTSLVYQLRDEKLRDAAVAYVDLQASAAALTRNCAPLYWEIERDLYLRLQTRGQEGANILRLGRIERLSEFPSNNSAQMALIFAEDMRAFLDALSSGKISGISRLVIVLDELERILPVGEHRGIEGYLELFGLLRGLAQTERYRGLVSGVVVAANAAISERGYWEGRENPVFALYKQIFLPPLSEDECVEMVRTLGKGMSVYWSDEALHAVYTETGGHPFLTRSFCSRIARRNPARPLNVTVEMVQAEIAPFIRDEGDKMEQITELLHINFPEEELLLEQIALDEMPPEVPTESLRHLLGYHLITQEGNNYKITLNLLRRWLRRRAGVKE